MAWKSTIGTIAPALATALGGPLAGTAVRALSSVLLGREDGDADELRAAVSAGLTPEQLTAVQQSDREFRQHLADLGIRLEEIATADRASAREREIRTGDWMPRLLAALVLLAGFGAEGWLLVHGAPQTVPGELVGRILGTLDAAVMLVLAYYFGSSSGSAQKTAVLSRIAGEKP